MTTFKKGDRVVYTGKSKTYSDPAYVGYTATVHCDDGFQVKVHFDHESFLSSFGVYPENIKLIEGKKKKPLTYVNPKSQTGKLLEHFKTHPSISNVEAQAIYRIRALPRRIVDLEEKGYVFNRETRVDPTGQRYVRYFFLGHSLDNVTALKKAA